MEKTFKHSYVNESENTAALAVYNVGFQRCDPLYEWGPGVRDHFLIHHVISGKGSFTVGGVRHELHAGDTFLIYPFTEVSYQADENEPWEYYWVGFAGSEAKLLLERTEFSKDNPIISTDFGDKLKNAFLEIYNCRGVTEADNARMTGHLYIALSLLMDIPRKSEKQEDLNAYYVGRACEFISYNYSRSISIDDIAEYAGLSRSHLYRVFMEVTSLSPKEYLTSFRIRRACGLIKSTDLNIGAIANSVGFEDNLYFSKVFKKIKGVSPKQYAEKHRK